MLIINNQEIEIIIIRAISKINNKKNEVNVCWQINRPTINNNELLIISSVITTSNSLYYITNILLLNVISKLYIII
jgi:hypothetical protein